MSARTTPHWVFQGNKLLQSTFIYSKHVTDVRCDWLLYYNSTFFQVTVHLFQLCLLCSMSITASYPIMLLALLFLN